jgi:hypothetical protein
MSGPNNTSSGGFLKPNPQPPTLVTTPPNLTFTEFLQNLLMNLSGFPGPFVRPEWQQKPPKQPEVNQNWLAFGLDGVNPDFNAYVGYDKNHNPFMQRNEFFGLVLSIYGPNSYDNYGLIRDGFQLTQNLTTLKAANIGFAYDSQALHVPELINEIWYDKWRVTFYMRRQLQRLYPILTFLTASGTIYANNQSTDTVTLPIAVEE